VTYCGCPHHLSSIRAAGFQKAGYDNVYAIDEGFFEWADRGLPMAGQSVAAGTQASRSEWEITGQTDPAYAGEYVWASAARQSEAAPVQADGRYRLHLRFTGVDAETPVTVRTPARTVERPLDAVGQRL
jgi:3-mercaptopyruvate sulfurtransferase SseA